MRAQRGVEMAELTGAEEMDGSRRRVNRAMAESSLLSTCGGLQAQTGSAGSSSKSVQWAGRRWYFILK